jgi:hypothetical protein
MIKQVVIQTSNPYSAIFPKRKIVSRNVLHLIKLLRSNGIETTIRGNDNAPLEYFVEKGFKEFISDPVNVFLVNIPLSFIVGIFSSAVYDKIKGQKANGIAEEKLIIHEDKNGSTLTYSEKGLPLSSEKIKTLINNARKYTTIQGSIPVSPNPSKYPCPIYLEHTPKIVGWSNLKDVKGALVTQCQITDKKTNEMIDKGILKGFSIGGLVKSSKCSICGKQYSQCNHITGQKYQGKMCTNTINSIDLLDISIVRDPVNAQALINRKEIKSK